MHGLRVSVAMGLVALFALAPASSLSTSTSNTVSVVASGEAGEWLFFYEPFAEPRTDLRFSFDVAVSATGDGATPTGLLTSRAWLVYDWGGGPQLRLQHVFEEHGPLYVEQEGGDLGFTAAESWRAGIGGGTFVGVFFVVGSNAPWSANVTVTIDDEPAGDGTPELLSRGSGTLLVPQGDRGETLTPNGALLGTLELDETIGSAGWTHLQYDYASLQPDGMREYDVVFPNGYTLEGSGRMTGVQTPTFGTASSSNWFDYAGTLKGTAGGFSSSLAYVQTASRLDASLIHMPMAPGDLPSGLTGGDYRGTTWPFHDLSVPTSGEDGRSLDLVRLA